MIVVDASAAGAKHLQDAVAAADLYRRADTQHVRVTDTAHQDILRDGLDERGITLAISIGGLDIECVFGLGFGFSEVSLEAADQATVADHGDHRLIGAALIEDLVFLRDILTSGLNQIAAADVIQVVIDVNDGSGIHGIAPYERPADLSPLFDTLGSPRG